MAPFAQQKQHLRPLQPKSERPLWEQRQILIKVTACGCRKCGQPLPSAGFRGSNAVGVEGHRSARRFRKFRLWKERGTGRGLNMARKNDRFWSRQYCIKHMMLTVFDVPVASNVFDRSTQSLKLRVWDYPNPKRQRGIVFLRFGSVSKNPSLTLRVMIKHELSRPWSTSCAKHATSKSVSAGLPQTLEMKLPGIDLQLAHNKFRDCQAFGLFVDPIDSHHAKYVTSLPSSCSSARR